MKKIQGTMGHCLERKELYNPLENKNETLDKKERHFIKIE